MNRRLAWIAVLLVLSGCAATPLRERSFQSREAYRHASRGITLHERGEFSSAGQEFSNAYRLYASIDDQQGMVTSLINSARTFRQTKQYTAAERELAKVYLLQPDTAPLPRELLFEEAQLALASGNLSLARAKTSAFLNGLEGEASAVGHNLLAIIARQEGNLTAARQEAHTALSSISNQQSSEVGNAHRLLGQLETQAAHLAAAEVHFTTALAIDRSNSTGKKIIMDLRALAEVAGLRGNMERKQQLLRHAREVALARGETETVQEIEALIHTTTERVK
jgi:tetratricopeptide (TPR) repeat protein